MGSCRVASSLCAFLCGLLRVGDVQPLARPIRSTRILAVAKNFTLREFKFSKCPSDVVPLDSAESGSSRGTIRGIQMVRFRALRPGSWGYGPPSGASRIPRLILSDGSHMPSCALCEDSARVQRCVLGRQPATVTAIARFAATTYHGVRYARPILRRRIWVGAHNDRSSGRRGGAADAGWQ